MLKTMTTGVLLASACFFGAASGHAQEIDENQPYAGVQYWKDTRNERMEWFREARFGLFIHWGLYSPAGGMWDGKVYPQHYAEWIQNWAAVPPMEYQEKARPGFTAARNSCDTHGAHIIGEDGLLRRPGFKRCHSLRPPFRRNRQMPHNRV